MRYNSNTDFLSLRIAAQDTLHQLANLDKKYFEAESYNNHIFKYDWTKPKYKYVVQVLDTDVLDIAKEYDNEKPCILNFASPFFPGGGWLDGAVAQEECIARRSSLYASIKDNEMYIRNKTASYNPFALDDMIYSPNVKVFKTADLKQPKDYAFDISVVTAAAVNMNHARGENQYEIDLVMLRRIRKVLEIMTTHGHDTIILGAWGCGAFGQDVYKVAQYFRTVLYYEKAASCFKNIIFAIYNDQPKLKVFKRFLKK